MEYLQAIFLGLIQGITEFLPISSTAHLLVVTKIFRWEVLGQKYYVDAIQFGSVIAVVLYFWQDIASLLLGSWSALRARDWQRAEGRIVLGIFVGTIPALGLGYLLRDVIPESTWVIGATSIGMAMLLGIAEQWGKRSRPFENLTMQDGLWVGMGQTIALIPGASRSGSTLTTALFLGLERQAAARFSFLLGIPTLTLATLFQSHKAIGSGNGLLLGVGVISSFVFSYLSIAWLLQFFQTRSSWIFIWYRLGFGGILLASSALQWIG